MEQSNYKVYPSVVKEAFKVEWVRENNLPCVLMDATGKEITPTIARREDNYIMVGMDGVSEGIYYLQITDSSGNVEVFKLMH